MKKLTFDEAMERIADDRPVKREDVQERALNRTVWRASNGIPGCLDDSFGLYETKRDAADSLIDSFRHTGDMAVPRGMVRALLGPGTTTSFAQPGEAYLFRVERMTLRDCL